MRPVNERRSSLFGFHAAETADRGHFGHALVFLGFEAEDVDDRHGIGGVVDGAHDEAGRLAHRQAHAGFRPFDDEFRLGLADTEDDGARIGSRAHLDGLLFEFGDRAVGSHGHDLSDEFGFGRRFRESFGPVLHRRAEAVRRRGGF